MSPDRHRFADPPNGHPPDHAGHCGLYMAEVMQQAIEPKTYQRTGKSEERTLHAVKMEKQHRR